MTLSLSFVPGSFAESMRLYLQIIEGYSKNHITIWDPEAAAQNSIGSLVHYMIVQEMLHGKDLIPLVPERLVDSLVELLTADHDQICPELVPTLRRISPLQGVIQVRNLSQPDP